MEYGELVLLSRSDGQIACYDASSGCQARGSDGIERNATALGGLRGLATI